MGFKRIFWGFIFMIDFRIGGFDLLPDFIGYILIYIGLGMLLDMHSRFGISRRYAMPLIFLSLLDIYAINIPLEGFSFQPTTLLMFVLGTITTIINLLMVYHLCMGIAESAEEKGNLI